MGGQRLLASLSSNSSSFANVGLTGKSDGLLARFDGDGKLVWLRGLDAGGQGRLSALAQSGNSGFVGAGTSTDTQGLLRLWLVGTNSTGQLIWQRQQAADVGAFNVRQLLLGPGEDLLIAGSRTIGGAGQMWFSRRSAEGVERWAKTWTLAGGSVTPAVQPLQYLGGGAVAMTGVITAGGKTDALFLRSDAWGHASCAEAGDCVGKTEADCDDNKVCTLDTCVAKASPGQTEGCQHTPAVCTTYGPCQVTACDAKAGCVYMPDPCSDGDACTVDSCDPAKADLPGGGCVHVAQVCDDGKQCTVDSCDPKSGCTFTAAADGKTCDTDGCNGGTCKLGQCDAALLSSKLGCTKLKPATSCQALLNADPNRVDGTYWLDPDGAKTAIAPFKGICDMDGVGGGWTLLMKHNGDCTFHSGADAWTKAYVDFDQLKYDLSDVNAKFPAFDKLPIKALRAEWFTLPMNHVLDLPEGTALSYTSGPAKTLSAPALWRHPSWPLPWSKFGIGVKYGFNQSRDGDGLTRWGAVYLAPVPPILRGTVGVGMPCSQGGSAGSRVYVDTYHAIYEPVRIWGR